MKFSFRAALAALLPTLLGAGLCMLLTAAVGLAT